MNLESLLNELSQSNPVVAYCHIFSEDKVHMYMTTCNFNMGCNSCHILRTACYIEEFDIKEFKNKINKLKDLSCILFFDNYPYEKDSKTSAEALLKFIIVASEKKNLNICLSTTRNKVDKIFKKYLTRIKYEEE